MVRLNRKTIVYITLLVSALFVLTYLFFTLKNEINTLNTVYINEVCSSNLRAYKDENGEHPDYIELYNSSDHDIDLAGWKISESRDNEKAWTFPEVIIPSGGYIIVNADETKAQIYPDEQYFSIRKYVMTGEGYVPEDTGLHASFSIPSKGTELFLSDLHDNLIDSTEVPELRYDTVYARTDDGGRQLKNLKPTPGETNTGAEEVPVPVLSEPVFSADSGFYDDPFMLSISSTEGGEIRYTLDGSEPDRDSELYTGPIYISDASNNDNVYCAEKNISAYLYDYYERYDFSVPDKKVDKCNVIRAAVFDKNGRVSRTVTKTYFVGFDKKKMYDGMKIISLVSEPDGLFGMDEGIYVLGQIGLDRLHKKYAESSEASRIIAENPDLPLDGSVKIGDVGYNGSYDGNYMQHGIDWEREADLTLFSADHDSVIMQQKVGIRVKGNSSRHYPVKGLNIYARKAYSGSDRFDVPFFEDDSCENRISLSAGGNDYYTYTKDSFVSERIKRSGINVAAGRFAEPVYLFLDGEYWGVYTPAERNDENFFSRNYGVDSDNVVFIKESEVEAGKAEDIHYYYVFLSLFEDKDFSNDDEYREFCEAVDIDSLMDYYSLRIFTEYGMDWPHKNYGVWRVKEEEKNNPYGDCKWRFVNFDNNVSLNYNEVNADMMDVLFNGTKNFGKDELFCALMKNRGFRREFKDRFHEVEDMLFSSEDVQTDYRKIVDTYRIPVTNSYGRWFGGNSDYDREFFEKETGDISLFIRERRKYIDPIVDKYCEQ